MNLKNSNERKVAFIPKFVPNREALPCEFAQVSATTPGHQFKSPFGHRTEKILGTPRLPSRMTVLHSQGERQSQIGTLAEGRTQRARKTPAPLTVSFGSDSALRSILSRGPGRKGCLRPGRDRRLPHRAQLGPWHHLVHFNQEHVEASRLAVGVASKPASDCVAKVSR